jgi:hypothetical protein
MIGASLARARARTPMSWIPQYAQPPPPIPIDAAAAIRFHGDISGSGAGAAFVLRRRCVFGFISIHLRDRHASTHIKDNQAHESSMMEIAEAGLSNATRPER